jgi:acetylornithine deacetylase
VFVMGDHGRSRDLAHLLGRLIAIRTDGRGDERPLAELVEAELARHAPDSLELAEVPVDDGTALAYVYAVWGAPRLLINAHLDTVPPNVGWRGDPFSARIDGDRLYGLGAADTKGAIAAVLTALAEVRPRDCAVLFSGDEERDGRCMRAFIARGGTRGVEQALVCEPTGLRAGTRHRGILALEAHYRGEGGHSSRADQMPAPIAELARLAVAFDDWGRARRTAGPPGFTGTCMNIGKLDGGVAFNVVPDAAKLSISVRPPPGAAPAAVAAELTTVAHGVAPAAVLRTILSNPSFATRSVERFRRWLGDRVDRPIDLGFWTEASMLAEAGVDAVVIGPGDIAQAHAAEEWVTLEQLEDARALFSRIFAETQR